MVTILIRSLILSTSTEIPLTSWEQAVVVVLFAVVFMAILGYLLAWFSRTQKDWQSFMKVMNNEWREWLDDANCRENEAMSKITTALDRLSEKLDAHDDKVDDRINKAVSSITKRNRGSQ